MKSRALSLKQQVLFFSIFCLLFLGLAGCENIPFLKPKKASTITTAPMVDVKGTVIARVNNMPIVLEDLDQEIEAYNANVPADKPESKITTREQKIEYLNNQMIRRAFLYQEALNRGLDRNEEVLKVLEKTKEDLLVMELVRQEAEKVEVSSKEIEDYYNSYKDQLKEPQELQVREIVVPTEAEAKDILIQLLQGTDFASLAKERSKSASAKDGGDLGFITLGKKFAQFDAVAETLEIGKTSNYFKGPDGYYLIRLEAKRGGKQKSLSELWEDIKRGLVFLKQQQKIEDLVAKLSREAKVEKYEGQIK